MICILFRVTRRTICVPTTVSAHIVFDKLKEQSPIPLKSEMELINDKISTELELGIVKEESKFNSNLLEDTRVRKNIKKSVRRFYRDITKKHTHIFQDIKLFLCFKWELNHLLLEKIHNMKV